MAKISTVETMKLDGGNPALDLVNSGYAVVPAEVVERLHHYSDLLTLAGRHGFITAENSSLLTEQAHADPDGAAKALKEVKEVRTALYHIFSMLSKSISAAIDQTDIGIFNSYLSDTLSHRKISLADARPVRAWKNQVGDLRQVLRHYVLCAYHLLTGNQNVFIKQCGGCAWMFVDESKNHRRKWCDMKICGASDKAKRYYKKRKQGNLQH